MPQLYRLATVRFRGRVFPVIELDGRLIDLNFGYEHYKTATGRQDFFKARHGYTMLDVLEEWDLFDKLFDDVVAFYVRELKGNPELDFVYRPAEVAFEAPILYPNKILNAGSNYFDHALEMGAAVPLPEKQEPYFFYKGSRNNVTAHGAPVRLTNRSAYTDWEAELAVVIGRVAKNVPRERAFDYIAGYTCYNDVSARDRMRRWDETFDYDWFSNKGNDSFAPMGPYILPRKFMPDVSDIEIRCFHNGDMVQSYSTKNIIFDVPRLVETATSVTTLNPGDIIAIGTGAGAGMAHGITAGTVGHGEMHKVFEHMYAGKSRLLAAGDTIAVEVDGIGRLENQVMAPGNQP